MNFLIRVNRANFLVEVKNIINFSIAALENKIMEIEEIYKRIVPECDNRQCPFRNEEKLFNCGRDFWVTECSHYKPKEEVEND